MPPVPQPSGLLKELWTDLQDVQVLWQLGAAVLCLLIAWLVYRLWRPVVAGNGEKPLKPQFKQALVREAMVTIMFPLTALLAAFIARYLMAGTNHNMLNVLISLLTAAVIIRLGVLMLRQVFAPSGWRDSLMRIVAVAVWIGFALHVAGFADNVVAFLDGLGFEAGHSRISLWLIVRGLLSVLATVLIALWLGRLIEARAMAATDLDINLRVMVAKLAQALLVLLAILLALPAVGIDLTVLSVFGGALGVGLGFGLQKIAGNYVSGFIILLDRSVSLGDSVTVDKHTGHLTKMTSRYVVVRSLGGVEAIIPNDTLITSTVINHSYTDKRVRKAVPIQISYECDPAQAQSVLETVAKAEPRVLGEPTPKALLKGFGESGIDMELGYWVDEPLTGSGKLHSDLMLAIWRAFKEHGIIIPYPQREVRLIGGLPAPAHTHTHTSQDT